MPFPNFPYKRPNSAFNNSLKLYDPRFRQKYQITKPPEYQIIKITQFETSPLIHCHTLNYQLLCLLANKEHNADMAIFGCYNTPHRNASFKNLLYLTQVFILCCKPGIQIQISYKHTTTHRQHTLLEKFNLQAKIN